MKYGIWYEGSSSESAGWCKDCTGKREMHDDYQSAFESMRDWDSFEHNAYKVREIEQSEFEAIAAHVGEIVTEKNAAYGSSNERAGKILAILYPDGVKPTQYTDMLLVARILDKLSRIATDKDALDEDPFLDIAGYGICGAALRE